jgi:branched-chain amino acid transport system substrate-binding protein
MAKFAREDLGLSRVAIFRDQGQDYSVGLADVFTNEFKKMGGTIVTDVSYKTGDADFRSQLAQIGRPSPTACSSPAITARWAPSPARPRSRG